MLFQLRAPPGQKKDRNSKVCHKCCRPSATGASSVDDDEVSDLRLG